MMATEFPVTLTFIGLCAAAMFPLIAWVGARRGTLKALHGDAGDPVLRNRIRIHGNFIETAPIAALAIGAGEYLQFSAIWLWLTLGSFIIGRVLHALWFDTMKRGFALIPTALPVAILGISVLLSVWV